MQSMSAIYNIAYFVSVFLFSSYRAVPESASAATDKEQRRARLQARCQMTVNRTTVPMRVAQFDADQIEMPVAHAALGDDLFGELPYPLNGTFENHALDT